MPKIKTNRSAAKRFQRTGTGKIRRRRAFANHMLESKSAKRKRRLRQPALISGEDSKKIRRLLPNG